MQNSKIKEVLQKAEKKRIIVTEERKFYVKKDLELILEYFEKLKKENPDITIEEMQRKFIDAQYKILVDFSTSANIRGKYFQYKAAKELLKNERKIEELCNQLKEDKTEYDTYNSNTENNYKVLIEDLKYALKHRDIPKSTLKIVESYIKGEEGINDFLSSKDKRKIEVLMKTMTDDETTNIKNLLKQLYSHIEKDAKESLIKSMETMGIFFDQFNLIGRYKSLNSSKLQVLGLSEIETPLCKDRSGKKEVELKQLFSKEILEQYSVEDLLVLNAFWQNRFAKETERINNAMFALTELQVLEKGDADGYTDEEIELVETKIGILKGISTIISQILSENIRKKDDKTEYQIVDVGEEVEAILKPFRLKYDEIIFKKTGKKDNNISNDYFSYAMLYNQLENAYKCKNRSMINILTMLFDSKENINWGCIINEVEENSDSRYILIGIDYEGMNMPVRLHIEREIIEEFLRDRCEGEMLPVYEGNEDFTCGGKVIATQVLMPASNRYKKQINNCLANPRITEKEKKMLEHLRYIKDRHKCPEHLKGTPKRMVNIKTNKITNICDKEQKKDGR